VSGRAVWELVGPAGRQKVEVRGAVAADDNEFIREAAAAGQGLTLLPIFACQGREKDDLQRVLPEYATVGVPLQLVYPTARFLPKRVVLLRGLPKGAVDLLTDPRAPMFARIAVDVLPLLGVADLIDAHVVV